MKFICIIFLLSFISIQYGQAPNIIWTKTYNSWYNYAELFGCAVDNSNGFYSVGSTRNNNPSSDHDILVVKFNAATGDSVWSAIYNGSSNKDDESIHCIADNAGGLYVVGYSDVGTANNTNDDIIILKYNTANGALLWSKTYNHNSVSPYSDEMGMSCALDESGNLYVAGWTFFNNKTEGILLKLNTSNQQIDWVKTFANATNNDDNWGGCVFAKPNTIYVGGYSFNGSTYNLITAKYNLNGDTIWTRRSENTLDSLDSPMVGLSIDANENIFISGCGGINKKVSSRNVYGQTIKYNSSGTFQWKSIIDGATEYDFLAANTVDKNNNMYCVGAVFPGNHEDDYAVYKLNGNTGSIIWTTSYNGPLNKADFALDCRLDNSGDLYITGATAWGIKPGGSGLLIKYKSTVTDIIDRNNFINDFKLYQNYPNPFSSNSNSLSGKNSSTFINFSVPEKADIAINIYNIFGELITTLINNEYENGFYSVNWNALNLPSGIYLCKLFANSKTSKKTYTSVIKINFIK